MHVQREQRTSEDRRAFAVYYRYGNERRNNTGNRRLDTVEELRPYFTGNISHACEDRGSNSQEIEAELTESGKKLERYRS